MSRYRGMTDGEREIWNEMQRDAAPDPREHRVLSQRRHTRGARPCLCDYCGAPIETGERYAAVSLINEGQFELVRHHVPTCPQVSETMSEGHAPDWAHAEIPDFLGDEDNPA